MLEKLKQRKYVIGGIFILVFAFYGITIRNEYSLDDDLVVYKNEKVLKGIKGIPQILTDVYARHGEHQYGYRPLTQISFAIEVSLWGANPHISHLINVLLYFLCCMGLYLFLCELFPGAVILTLIATLLYIIHPVHSEVVASLKNREELIAFCLGIFGSLNILKAMKKHNYGFSYLMEKKLWLGISLIVLGLFAKLSAYLFALIPLVSLFDIWKTSKRKFFMNIVFWVGVSLALAFTYKFIRHIVVGDISYRNYQYHENPLFFEKGIKRRILYALWCFWFYIKKCFFPYPLVSYYGYGSLEIPNSFSHPEVIAGTLSVLIMVGLAIVMLIRGSPIIKGIAVYNGTILPFLNLGSPVPGIVAERFLFIPSIGFCILIAHIIEKLFFHPARYMNAGKGKSTSNKFPYVKTGFLLLLLLTTVCLVYVNKRNMEWHNYYTLYDADLKKAPGSVQLNILKAQKMMADTWGKPHLMSNPSIYNTIKYHFYMALQVWEYLPVAWNNLGVLYFEYEKNIDSAFYCFQKAIELRDNYKMAYFNMGRVYEVKGDTYQAINMYFRANLMDSTIKEVYWYLLPLLYKLGKADSLRYISLRGISVYPQWDFLYVALANSYALKGDTMTAIQYFEKACILNPQNTAVIDHLLKIYNALGMQDRRQQLYRKLYGG